MTDIITLNGPMLPALSGTTKSVVILLHGYGADGQDLIGLAPELANHLPDTAFYSPNAPYPCEMSPFGRQWFSLAEYDPEFLRRQPETMSRALIAMAEGAARNICHIDAFIDDLCQRHAIPAAKLALIGFSQGTMMALRAAPARTETLAGVVGFSGALLGEDDFASLIASRPPITLIHGTDDPVVPIEASRIARDILDKNGFATQLHERPGLPHGIDQTGIALAGKFLASVLT